MIRYDLLEKHLDWKNLSDELAEMFHILGKAYFVGGCVRDLLIGDHLPQDFDISTPYDVNQFIPELESLGWKINKDNSHLFVIKASKNNTELEIVSFRKEVSNNRIITDIEVGTIETDSARRDFTVNALYFDPKAMLLIDPTNIGIKDINESKLRFIGDPDTRIEQDPMRILRFYKFLARGALKPEKHSLKACRRNFSKVLFSLSADQVREQIEAICL